MRLTMRLTRTAAVITTIATALALAACSAERNGVTPDAATGNEHLIGHIHGLGIDPSGNTLYVAGHTGVFTLEDGVATRVADRWQDTMAFTITGPHTFLASGHPDLSENLPSHLGLIESTDGAQTWIQLSLEGEADFHALEVVGDRIYGYDSTSSRLMTTTNRTDWHTLTTGQFIDLAALPGLADEVIAATPTGQLVGINLKGAQRSFPQAPPLVWIDATPDGLLVGATLDGKIFTAPAPTGEWTAAGSVPGDTAAIDATDSIWHVATHDGVYASTNHGTTWVSLLDGEQ